MLEFLGLESFTLTESNTASVGGYDVIYKKVCDSITLPPEFIEKIYGSRYVRHFYSEKEITDFKQKWAK
jgi:hypothetical protein